MKTTIQSDSSLSNTTYHRRCASDGQRRWWLRRENGEFIDIGRHRGDQDLDVTIDLPPGKYTLGCGPQGKFGIRQAITVERN